MNGFGEGEGELLTLHYPKPLPMRLDRWLVSQRPEQSRARIQKFIEAGYVQVNGTTKEMCGYQFVIIKILVIVGLIEGGTQTVELEMEKSLV